MSEPDARNSMVPSGRPSGGDGSEDHDPSKTASSSGIERSGAAHGASESDSSRLEDGTLSDTAAAPKGKGEERGRRAKRLPISTLGDLLRAVYGGSQKRVSPKKPEIAAIREAWKLESSEFQELLSLAGSDRTLEMTCGLMLLSVEHFDKSALAGEVRAFVREVLRRHPAFLPDDMAAVFEGSNGIREAEVRALASQSYKALAWPDGTPALKKKEAELCRLNALYCLMLWFQETRGTALERIQRHLQTHIWAPKARGYKTDTHRLRALISTRDLAGVAVISSLLTRQVTEQSTHADAARRAEERAVARTRALEDQLAGTEAALEQMRVEAQRLEEELCAERVARENETAHLRDGHEQVRGRVLGRLRKEQSLLDEGLHALRRDPPKIHVMVDHAERAIEGLKREIERLRGDD